MAPLQVYWAQCMSDRQRVWCSLKTVDTENIKTSGVYIIWYGGRAPRVVYIGQGDIAGRINHHRISNRILRYESKGLLMVTWANVSDSERRGVEQYLTNTLDPIRGEHNDIPPIPVNLPWPDPPTSPQ